MMVLTITVTDGDDFKERKKHNRHYSSVMVHQLENIDSHLKRHRLFEWTGAQTLCITLLRLTNVS